MKRNKAIFLFILWFILGYIFQVQEAEAKPEVHVQPNKIHISAFFKGQELKIFGKVPIDWDIAIKIDGSREEVHLSRKGKVGVLWMNVGTVSIKGAPNFYFVSTSTNIENLAPPELLEKLELGYKYLSRHLHIESTLPEDKPDFLFDQFVALKQKEKLYKVESETISFGKPEGELKPFSLILKIPTKISPGEYIVNLYGFKDGQLVGSLKSFFDVELVGFPAFTRNLAFNHSLIYGILAVVLAIIVGSMMGFLFGNKGGH
ncbi:MAG: TIGR02186 family protein [Candidatus Desulfofervidaceae bacterium]|nr:TIGR02186 family protein [Candidatus Desulfofervidaceae bacterium]